MLNFITIERWTKYEEETKYRNFIGSSTFGTYRNVVRFYAYYYIMSLEFENFKLKLKQYVE